MAEFSLENIWDARCCVLCNEMRDTSHDMLIHLLAEHCEPFDTWKINQAFLCPCGEMFAMNMREGYRDSDISPLKAHMCGRPGAGITSPNITLEEIRDHLWTAYHARILGVTP